MPNKKIVVSSGSGSYQEAPLSSFSINNDSNKLTINNLNAATASFRGGTSGSVMQVYDGKLMPIWTTSSILAYSKDENDEFLTPSDLSGTLFQFKTGMENYNGIGPHRIGSASFSGDVIGTISSSIPARVVSVANVNKGILNSKFGGTGTGSFDVGSLVTLSGSGLNVTNGNNSVVATNNSGDWSYANKNSIEPTEQYLTGAVIYLYTGSIGSNYTDTWIKPGAAGSPITAKARFIKVICQGGGGGGGGAYAQEGGNAGGAGGGGGGYSECVYNGFTFPGQVEVFVGAGGSGAGPAGNGAPGVSSSFGNFLYALGGKGGQNSRSAWGTQSGYTRDTVNYMAGGIGYTLNGGMGGYATTSTGYHLGMNGESVILGGAGGGAGGFNGSVRAGDGGTITSVNILPGAVGTANTNTNATTPGSGNALKFKNLFLNNNQITEMPNILWAGGSGGTTALTPLPGTSGSSPRFGSGGGGGGEGAANTSGARGGGGYVLIICT